MPPALRSSLSMLWFCLSLSLRFFSQVSPFPPQSVSRADPRAILDSAAAAELRLFYAWGEAWRVSEASRHRVALVGWDDTVHYRFREILARCLLGTRGETGTYAAAIGTRGIPSASGPSTYWGPTDRKSVV